ncbi:MAG: hypothetical protein E7A23_10385, partial [Enterobacter sp.]|nr:hypothetical protein [Enterobacter sp.]
GGKPSGTGTNSSSTATMTGSAIISNRFAFPFDAWFATGGVTAVFVFIVSRLKLSKIRSHWKITFLSFFAFFSY